MFNDSSWKKFYKQRPTPSIRVLSFLPSSLALGSLGLLKQMLLLIFLFVALMFRSLTPIFSKSITTCSQYNLGCKSSSSWLSFTDLSKGPFFAHSVKVTPACIQLPTFMTFTSVCFFLLKVMKFNALVSSNHNPLNVQIATK